MNRIAVASELVKIAELLVAEDRLPASVFDWMAKNHLDVVKHFGQYLITTTWRPKTWISPTFDSLQDMGAWVIKHRDGLDKTLAGIR